MSIQSLKAQTVWLNPSVEFWVAQPYPLQLWSSTVPSGALSSFLVCPSTASLLVQASQVAHCVFRSNVPVSTMTHSTEDLDMWVSFLTKTRMREFVLIFSFLCFFTPVDIGRKALFQWQNEIAGCMVKKVNAVTVAFVLQSFSQKGFQITLQYQPQCVLCSEKISLIIKALL